MSAPKIILTGHRGYIGSALKALLETDSPDQLVLTHSDLRDAAKLAEELAPFAGENVLVLHFATINRAGCNDYASHSSNGEMVLNLIRATEHCASRQFLFASTTDVFGAPTQLPVTEFSIHQPLDWYALSKSVGEWILRHDDIPHTVFRLPGIYGARPNESRLLSRLLKQGQETGRIRLNARGAVLRDFVYLEDLLALVLAWIHSPRSGVYNVASGKSYPLVDLLMLLKEHLDADFCIECLDNKTTRDFDLVFDTARLRRAFPSVAVRALETTASAYCADLKRLTPAAAL